MAQHETMVVRCPACETHEVGGIRGYYQFSDHETGEQTRYSLVPCPKCARPFLTEEDGVDDQTESGASYVSWGRPLFLYPNDATKLDASVPTTIGASFYEAQRAF